MTWNMLKLTYGLIFAIIVFFVGYTNGLRAMHEKAHINHLAFTAQHVKKYCAGEVTDIFKEKDDDKQEKIKGRNSRNAGETR